MQTSWTCTVDNSLKTKKILRDSECACVANIDVKWRSSRRIHRVINESGLEDHTHHIDDIHATVPCGAASTDALLHTPHHPRMVPPHHHHFGFRGDAGHYGINTSHHDASLLSARQRHIPPLQAAGGSDSNLAHTLHALHSNPIGPLTPLPSTTALTPAANAMHDSAHSHASDTSAMHDNAHSHASDTRAMHDNAHSHSGPGKGTHDSCYGMHAAIATSASMASSMTSHALYTDHSDLLADR